MRAELSACVIQNSNGYDLLRSNLKYSEKKNLVPIDIVYEPTLNTVKPIECFFANEIHLTFNTAYDKIVKGNKTKIKCSIAKQCPYCNNFFMKSENKIKEHTGSCAGQLGFSYSFDNGRIINYQDNFNKLGNLPFAVYYDFEKTIGSVVFLTQKCMWSVIVWLLPFMLILIYRAFTFIGAIIKTTKI